MFRSIFRGIYKLLLRTLHCLRLLSDIRAGIYIYAPDKDGLGKTRTVRPRALMEVERGPQVLHTRLQRHAGAG